MELNINGIIYLPFNKIILLVMYTFFVYCFTNNFYLRIVNNSNKYILIHNYITGIYNYSLYDLKADKLSRFNNNKLLDKELKNDYFRFRNDIDYNLFFNNKNKFIDLFFNNKSIDKDFYNSFFYYFLNHTLSKKYILKNIGVRRLLLNNIFNFCIKYQYSKKYKGIYKKLNKSFNYQYTSAFLNKLNKNKENEQDKIQKPQTKVNNSFKSNKFNPKKYLRYLKYGLKKKQQQNNGRGLGSNRNLTKIGTGDIDITSSTNLNVNRQLHSKIRNTKVRGNTPILGDNRKYSTTVRSYGTLNNNLFSKSKRNDIMKSNSTSTNNTTRTVFRDSILPNAQNVNKISNRLAKKEYSDSTNVDPLSDKRFLKYLRYAKRMVRRDQSEANYEKFRKYLFHSRHLRNVKNKKEVVDHLSKKFHNIVYDIKESIEVPNLKLKNDKINSIFYSNNKKTSFFLNKSNI